MSDATRTKPRARAIRRPRVERRANERNVVVNVGVGETWVVSYAAEGRDAREDGVSLPQRINWEF